jgi:telomerase reverse transcriptase
VPSPRAAPDLRRQIGNDYYQQVIGIPQGSVMSSLLCSFFYGDLERTHFAPLLADPGTLLVRLIDDYMLVSTDVAAARGFLDAMARGHPEYGCFIAREKTVANFDHQSEAISVVAQRGTGQTLFVPLRHLLIGETAFPWCGYLINTKDLSVSVDYSRFRPNRMARCCSETL